MHPTHRLLSTQVMKANPNVIKMAQEQMAKMSPEQMKQASDLAQKQMEAMAPEDLEKMADSAIAGAGGPQVVDVDVEAVNDAPSWIMPPQSSLPLRGQEGTIEPTWVFRLNPTNVFVLVTSV